MARPTDRNRLDEAASPYLQQHADNPVHWQPWDETALAAARELDRPIFLSVGYSSCHWCHVMAEESFEDPAIAERLNRDFVPIKVDREERPDVDSIYMTVCRLVTRGGCGWPLSVWLTPDWHPFYVGTYFPPAEKHGRPAFGDLLESIAESWETEREALEERGEAWLAAASDELESVPVPSDSGTATGTTDTDVLEAAGDQFLETADRTHGGFGTGQKFPHVDRLLVLARLADRTDREEYETVLSESLDAMATGGLRDQLGGGFHRYCVDRDWTVPHFEKMLYDNAEIPRAFLAGYALTGAPSSATVVEETFDFVDRELTHPDGGFYSTLDARSPPKDGDPTAQSAVEGAFYTWTPAEVRSAMEQAATGNDTFDPDWLVTLFRERFGVTQAGNFEGETVLTQSRSIDELAEEFDRSVAEIEISLTEAIERARRAREKRPRPPRDEKILADWNGLLIGSLATASIVLDVPEFADMAGDALEFVRENHWDGTRLAHRYRDGDRLDVDYLADYAFLARAALKLHGATGELAPLSFALDLGRAMRARFWDPAQETLFFTTEGADGLPIRPTGAQDESTPSSTAVAVEVLAALHHFDPGAGFESVAGSILQSHREQLESSPERFATLAMAADRLEHGYLEVTIAADSIPAEWRSVLGDEFRPGLLLTRRPPDEQALGAWLDVLGLDSAPPIWAGRAARGEPTAFVCRLSCSPPVTDAADLEDRLAEFALSGSGG
ncbi:MAG: thioredoxin domain-containing protein [Halodesulfurarchaeum sp.]|nr:thioredoxin domain-containing protein [Halodesulfurarchaeum sp.]